MIAMVVDEMTTAEEEEMTMEEAGEMTSEEADEMIMAEGDETTTQIEGIVFGVLTIHYKCFMYFI